MCVIDDIPTVVQGICSQIDWERYGIEVCGSALNGEDGLALIRTCQPDIILTDIRMPKLDGLEMARIVREELPHGKVILLTGYTDFQYAKEAIGLGVFDFVTKPFSLDQIEAVIEKAAFAVREEWRQSLRLQQLEKQAKEILLIQRQQYLKLIVRHKTDEVALLHQWHSLQIDLEPERLIVALLEIDRFGNEEDDLAAEETELNSLILQNIVEETISRYTKGIVIRDTENRFLALFNATENMSAGGIAGHCCANMSRYARFTVSVGLGGEAASPHELHRSYQQAVIALSYRFYTEGNAVCVYADISTDAVLPVQFKEKQQEWLLLVSCGSGDKALTMLDELLQGMMAEGPLPDPEYIRSACSELAFLMLHTFHEKLEEGEFEAIPAHLRGNWAVGKASYKDLQQQLRALCELGCAMIAGKHRADADKPIREAIRYILEHLHLNLTVNLCAKRVHLSPSYFAALFKKTTGVTFNVFLNRERMKRAKEMLLENRQIQDIADSLGYEERRYFSSVFKKNTGLTPSEFKEKFLSAGPVNRDAIEKGR